ncbi:MULTISPECIES: Na+/H+ antiporter subunit D [unclassified Streptomyces]|uniref:Na+/H+ antiporter subunit D n=1 Tax=unclassified Streptomyces TaxID=2593676 RepID=UPI000DBA5EC7|nr:Na+/H+ antiporter subunit D [Streptomyces sp. PsTaAH-137]MYT75413.1 Na+/H+ antiporter subunit D [Streptomyces sp. SID8367]RAJ86815.1 multisubunit sodium/proton antiporter MrpD subunit [Streptomyces sp. PsTaAH-137]
MNALVPLPVVMPLTVCGLSLFIGPRLRWLHRLITVGVLAGVVAVDLVLLVESDRIGPLVVHLGDFGPPLGVTLVADRLAALMLTVSGAVTLIVLVYAMGQDMADREENAPLAVFHPAYLVLVSGVSLTFLAGDLVNLYVGFEIMLMASFVLLTVGATEPRIRAGSTYVVVSLVSSLVFLAGVAVTYAAAGTVNFAQLAVRLPELPLGVRTMAEVLLLTVFGVKAAAFPVAAWLPDSYPTAPAPVTAVFAGLLTKVGVYSMIRAETLLFPGNRLSAVLMAVAFASMVIGIIGAVAQTDLKRLLSFTLVSHIGFMLFGLALGSRGGIGGAIVYTAHHITVQTTLFLAAGLLEKRYGTTELTRLGGAARTAPLLAALWFVPAMNLAGIPPLSGFIGKLGLMRAGAADGGAWAYVLLAGAAVTSLLTLYVMVKVWNLAFWRGPATTELPVEGDVLEESDDPDSDPEEGSGPMTKTVVRTTARIPRVMTAATAAAVALGLSYTVLATPLTGLADRSAAELLARTPYVKAVLGP